MVAIGKRTKCNPSTVSAPYSDIKTGFLCFEFHKIASSTTLDVIISKRPGFEYQPLYRLKLIISKNCAYLNEKNQSMKGINF